LYAQDLLKYCDYLEQKVAYQQAVEAEAEKECEYCHLHYCCPECGRDMRSA